MTKAKIAAEEPGICPLGDRELVQRLEAEKRTAGGIILPDKARKKPLLKQGNRATFGKFPGTDFMHDGQEYLLIDESDILAAEE